MSAIPTTGPELEEYLSDAPKVMALLRDKPGEFKELIGNYARIQVSNDSTLLAQVRDETQRAMVEFLKANGQDVKDAKKLNLNPLSKPDNRYNKMRNPRALGAKLDGEFEDVSSFLQAVWHGGNPDRETLEKVAKFRVQNYQEKIPAEGGFLVPEEFRAELLRLSLETGIVRPRARVVPMQGHSLRFPTIDSTSNASSVFGGVVVYRTEEGAELVESQATFGSIKLEPSKQTALAHVTNELVRDWGAFGVFIEEVFPQAMAYYEDMDFLSGSGVGEPLGALAAQNTAMVVVAKETNQTASTIVWENVIKMYARMLPTSVANAVWIASPDVFAELATMGLVIGTGGSAVWLTDAHGAPQLTLLGRPVIMSEKTPGILGAQGDLSFVDLGMYLIGDRQLMTVDSSPHVKFTSDKTTYRIIARNDGRPWLQSAITPANGSATLSPFVQLAVRA